jgi:hypothetical protein
MCCTPQETPAINISSIAGLKELLTIVWAKIYTDFPSPNVGAIRKKVSTEAILMLFYLEKVSVKRLYRFKSQKF